MRLHIKNKLMGYCSDVLSSLRNSWPLVLTLFVMPGLVYVSFVVYFRHAAAIAKLEFSPTLEHLALLGDSFGSVNAWIGALSTALIAFTLIAQVIQLSHQRHELALQRREMHDSRQALQDQARHSALQFHVAAAQIRAQALTGQLRVLEERAQAGDLGMGTRPPVSNDMQNVVREIEMLAEHVEKLLSDDASDSQ